jgi:hypothetical protein
MKWIDHAERKFGHLAIPGLLRWVALANCAVFIAYKLYPPTFYILDLYPGLVLSGEIWRLVTYIFIPSICNLIPLPDWFNAAIFVLFMWWCGDGLDRAWGPFKTNLFYLLGMIGTTIAAFFFGAAFSNTILNLSVFFAFARFYGDTVIYMFFVLPMKVKWAAWLSAAWLLWEFVPYGLGAQSALAAALINYLLFFGREIVEETKLRHEVKERRARFDRALAESQGDSLHRCAVCGRTEHLTPDLEFRVASDGQEYCGEHLPKPAAPQ